MSGAGQVGEVPWRCGTCCSTNSPLHRMCTNCKKWRDLDWSCVMCGYKNFAKRDTCKECGAGHVPEFNKEEGNYNIMCQEETGFQDSYCSQLSYQAPLDPPFQAAPELQDVLWMCGMCNTENTPKRILCFECSGHRDRVEVRNRAAESRMAGGRNSLPPPGPLPPPVPLRFPSPHRDVSRVQYHQDGAVEDQTHDWVCSNCNNRNFAKRAKCNVCKKVRSEVELRRETPPWITVNSPHIREQPREGAQDRPEDRTKDWACSNCSNRNFAKRQECNRCKKPKAEVEDKTVDYSSEETPTLKRGPEPMLRNQTKVQRRSLAPRSLAPRQEDLSNDWICGKCNINCFAKKTNCFRCGKPRSDVENREVDVSKFYPAHPLSRPPHELNLSGHHLRINPTNWTNSRHPPDNWTNSRLPPEKKQRKWVDEDKSADWNCKLCKINNFAKRKSCFSCNKSRDDCEERTEESVKEDCETEPLQCEAD